MYKDVGEVWSEVKTPELPEIIDVELDSHVTALLVLDIQKQNCNKERRPRCVETIKKVVKIIEKARKKQVKIVYSLTSSADIEDMLPEVAPLEDEPYVKSGVDKFYETKLNEILKEDNISNLVLVGTSSEGAILNTATGASLRGYSVIVPIDGLSSSKLYSEQYTVYHLANSPGTRRRTTLTRIQNISFK